MSSQVLLRLLPLLVCAACASSPAPMAPVPAPAGLEATYPAFGGQRYQAQPPALAQPIRPPASVRPAANFGEEDAGLQGMAAGETERAEQSFERALEVNPFDPVALNNLAVAKAEQGQFHEATALLERAAKLQPDNAEIAANLARLRGYVQGYAMAGVEPAGPVQPSASGLPPEPPQLWSERRAALPRWSTGSEGQAQTAPATAAKTGSGYYLSEACRQPSAAAASSKGKTKPSVGAGVAKPECPPAR